ncbi:HAD family hydrolase [Gaiella sp.]|uniref:HAD family hydrolase n=1 Tax=Gaiella sp. TaxID=2663207 RepID=UPI003264D8CD
MEQPLRATRRTPGPGLRRARLAGLTEEAIVGGWLGVDGPLRGSLMAERIAGLLVQITPIVAADDVQHGKPHPEGYLRALALLDLDVAEVVAFEDSEAGIAAAKSAGVRCIAVRGTLADDLADAIDVPLLQRLLAPWADPTIGAIAECIPRPTRVDIARPDEE